MNRIVEARIEIPMGSQNKYEIKNGKIKLDRVLYSSAHYPVEYGYVENTLSMDGDELDILVFTSAPTFPGCYIDSKIVGGMYMIDSGEEDVKLIAVNINDPRYEQVDELKDLPPHILKELENFFSTYKTLQGKETIVKDFFGVNDALRHLEDARVQYQKSQEFKN